MARGAKGAVTRIYAAKDHPNTPPGTYYRLNHNLPADETPKSEYFYLPIDHENYNALYSLALMAAANRLALSITTVAETTPDEYAEVMYMVVDWPAD